MLTKRAFGRFSAGARSWRPRYGPLHAHSGLASLAQGPSPNDIFANGTSAYYADEMYRLWKEDPKSVHPSWSVYFSGLENGLPSSQAFQPPPTLTTHLPHPADGVPALHVGQGAQLDDHLKVCCSLNSVILILYSCYPIGTTPRPRISSPGSSLSRARSPRHPRCRFG